MEKNNFSCDVAGQYLRGMAGFPRVGDVHEVMKLNKRALHSIYLVAMAFRDILESNYSNEIGMIHDEECSINSWNSAEKVAYEQIMENLMPNNVEKKRSIQRNTLSIPKNIYDEFNLSGEPGSKEEQPASQKPRDSIGGEIANLLTDDEEEFREEVNHDVSRVGASQTVSNRENTDDIDVLDAQGSSGITLHESQERDLVEDDNVHCVVKCLRPY